MPLIKASLESELKSIYSNDNVTGSITANKTATALNNYWMTALAPLGGAVTVIPGIPLIISGLTTTFSTPQPAATAAAAQIATAIMAAFMTMIIAGGAFGIGGIAIAQVALLQTGLETALFNPPTRELFATNFATAVHTFSTTCTVFGTGVPPAFVPPLGPLA